MIRDVFTLDVELIIFDEVSMILSKLIFMMDENFWQIYNATKMFGGKDVLLSSDILKMKAFVTAI